MQSLYRRLKVAGFDRRFLQDFVLPDWWDDSLASNPSNRAIAEMTMARMLGFSVSVLRDADAVLALPVVTGSRLKRTADVEPSALAPAIRVAECAARNLSSCLSYVPAFAGEQSAAEVRTAILSEAPTVGLSELVDFAWRNGILVTQLVARPERTGKLHGLAMYCDSRPAAVLTSGSDAPAWQAFRLAHEVGHVMLGHVRVGDGPIFDASQNLDDPDEEEQQANAFALEVLTGDPRPTMRVIPGLTAIRLAAQAPSLGLKHGIDPGTLLLVYGYSADRIPAAQNALKILGLTTGARQIVAEHLRAHLEEDLPETVAQAAALAGVD